MSKKVKLACAVMCQPRCSYKPTNFLALWLLALWLSLLVVILILLFIIIILYQQKKNEHNRKQGEPTDQGNS
jgi:flagellar biosynthesis/type III secretory pathway M-ring protein FliF/YscJ